MSSSNPSEGFHYIDVNNQIRKFVLNIQDLLSSSNVTLADMRKAQLILRPTHFISVMEERSDLRLCAYPLCTNTLTPQQAQRKDYFDLATQEYIQGVEYHFCSPGCEKLALEYSANLSDEPVTSRSILKAVVVKKPNIPPNPNQIHSITEENVSDHNGTLINAFIPPHSDKDTINPPFDQFSHMSSKSIGKVLEIDRDLARRPVVQKQRTQLNHTSEAPDHSELQTNITFTPPPLSEVTPIAVKSAVTSPDLKKQPEFAPEQSQNEPNQSCDQTSPSRNTAKKRNVKVSFNDLHIEEQRTIPSIHTPEVSQTAQNYHKTKEHQDISQFVPPPNTFNLPKEEFDVLMPYLAALHNEKVPIEMQKIIVNKLQSMTQLNYTPDEVSEQFESLFRASRLYTNTTTRPNAGHGGFKDKLAHNHLLLAKNHQNDGNSLGIMTLEEGNCLNTIYGNTSQLSVKQSETTKERRQLLQIRANPVVSKKINTNLTETIAKNTKHQLESAQKPKKQREIRRRAIIDGADMLFSLPKTDFSGQSNITPTEDSKNLETTVTSAKNYRKSVSFTDVSYAQNETAEIEIVPTHSTDKFTAQQIKQDQLKLYHENLKISGTEKKQHWTDIFDMPALFDSNTQTGEDNALKVAQLDSFEKDDYQVKIRILEDNQVDENDNQKYIEPKLCVLEELRQKQLQKKKPKKQQIDKNPELLQNQIKEIHKALMIAEELENLNAEPSDLKQQTRENSSERKNSLNLNDDNDNDDNDDDDDDDDDNDNDDDDNHLDIIYQMHEDSSVENEDDIESSDFDEDNGNSLNIAGQKLLKSLATFKKSMRKELSAKQARLKFYQSASNADRIQLLLSDWSNEKMALFYKHTVLRVPIISIYDPRIVGGVINDDDAIKLRFLTKALRPVMATTLNLLFGHAVDDLENFSISYGYHRTAFNRFPSLNVKNISITVTKHDLVTQAMQLASLFMPCTSLPQLSPQLLQGLCFVILYTLADIHEQQNVNAPNIKFKSTKSLDQPNDDEFDLIDGNESDTVDINFFKTSTLTNDYLVWFKKLELYQRQLITMTAPAWFPQTALPENIEAFLASSPEYKAYKKKYLHVINNKALFDTLAFTGIDHMGLRKLGNLIFP